MSFCSETIIIGNSVKFRNYLKRLVACLQHKYCCPGSAFVPIPEFQFSGVAFHFDSELQIIIFQRQNSRIFSFISPNNVHQTMECDCAPETMRCEEVDGICHLTCDTFFPSWHFPFVIWVFRYHFRIVCPAVDNREEEYKCRNINKQFTLVIKEM